jgi:hypothetical protein
MELKKSSNEMLLLPLNNWTKSFEKPIYSSSFKSEYPHSKKYKTSTQPIKFDIAFIEKDEKGNNFFLWPCSILLELKLYFGKLNTSLLLNDFNKIVNYKKRTENLLGISIIFDQDPSQDLDNIINRYRKKKDNFTIINLKDLELLDNHNHAIHLIAKTNRNCLFLKESII